VHGGLLKLAWVMLAAFTGTMLSDIASYLIGRHFGQAALARRSRRWRARARLTERLLARYGAPAIVGYRFIFGMRTVAALGFVTLHVSPARLRLLSGQAAGGVAGVRRAQRIAGALPAAVRAGRRAVDAAVQRAGPAAGDHHRRGDRACAACRNRAAGHAACGGADGRRCGVLAPARGTPTARRRCCSPRRDGRAPRRPAALAIKGVDDVAASGLGRRLAFQLPARVECVAQAERVDIAEYAHAVADIELRRQVLADHEGGIAGTVAGGAAEADVIHAQCRAQILQSGVGLVAA